MVTDRLSLNQKHVVITGASSGLGEALALEMANHGARITLLARRKQLLESVAQEVRDRGGEALALATDVTLQESVDVAIAQAVEQWGPVEILVANAGISPNMSALEFDVPLVENAMQVNFFGVVYAMNAVLPSMVARQNGLVLAISSAAAFRGLPTMSPYCASKSAVTAWMESLRSELDLQQTGVRLITSHPGYIRTHMTEDTDAEMPFLIEAQDAARILVRGMFRSRSQINFPWEFMLMLRSVGRLPDRLYDRAVWSTASDPVTWDAAARDACVWLLGGLGILFLAGTSLRAVSSVTAETLKIVYLVTLPLLAGVVLLASARLRGSIKIPTLILLFTIPLAAIAGLGRLFGVW